MGWISRHKDKDHAKQLEESLARDYEKYLGRELTPAEVKAVREEAKRPLKTRGEQSRKS